MNFFERLKQDLNLNRLKGDATKRAKAPVLREIDRAIGKLENGADASEVILGLRQSLLAVFSKALPPIIGPLLLDLVLAKVNWDELETMAAEHIVIEIKRIRTQVERVRL